MVIWIPKTKEQFIASAKEKHGDTFDYSHVVYIGAASKVAIKCSQHGIFWQRASSHIEGRGCNECSNQKRRNLNTEMFIKLSQEIHKNKYDYSEAVFAGTRKKVKVICPIHGLFEQFPLNHLRGHGCRSCYNQFVNRCTTEQFIDKAMMVHGTLYDYSKVKYIGNKDFISITCKDHGVFLQRPVNHLQGNGCPSCARQIALRILSRNRNGNKIC